MRHAYTSTVLALSLFTSASAIAQSDAALMLVPWGEGEQVQIQTEGFYTPTESNVGGVDVDLSIFDATGRLRLDPNSTYDPTIGFEFTHFEIGSGDAALPDDMTDVSVAFGGSFGEVDFGDTLGTWQAGYTLGIGYSGTNLFGDGDGYYGKADLYAIKPIDKDTRWLVGLNYDGNRVFLPDIPLPAVAYFSRLNETTTYALGVPFSRITWKPDDQWTLDARTALFFSFNGSVRFQATEELELFAAYVRRSDAFHASGGLRDRRFLFSQQRLELGLTYEMCANAAITLAGGFAFDQEIDFGYDTRDPRGLRDLDDSGYIRCAVEFSY